MTLGLEVLHILQINELKVEDAWAVVRHRLRAKGGQELMTPAVPRPRPLQMCMPVVWKTAQLIGQTTVKHEGHYNDHLGCESMAQNLEQEPSILLFYILLGPKYSLAADARVPKPDPPFPAAGHAKEGTVMVSLSCYLGYLKGVL